MQFDKNTGPDLSNVDPQIMYTLLSDFYNHTVIATEKLKDIFKGLFPYSEFQEMGYNLDVILTNPDNKGIKWEFAIVGVPINADEKILNGEEVEYLKVHANEYILEDSRPPTIKQNNVILHELIMLVKMSLPNVDLDLNTDMSTIDLDKIRPSNFITKLDDLDSSIKLKKKD